VYVTEQTSSTNGGFMIFWFSRLKIHTHLNDAQKEELMRILGADEVGSETSFEFFLTLDYDNRQKFYGFACKQFPDRILVMSNLDVQWVMISFSITPTEMDDSTIEDKLNQIMLRGIAEIDAGAPIKIPQPPHCE